MNEVLGVSLHIAFTLPISMGEYAGYIWTAYGLAFLVLALLSVTSFHRLRTAERTLSALEQVRPTRRTAEA